MKSIVLFTTVLRIIIITVLIAFTIFVDAQSVAVNTTGNSADASAMLDISSNSKGILITRLSTAQRIAIGTPAEGLLVFDTDTKGFWYFSLVKEPNHKLDIDMSRLKSPEFKKWMDR